MAKAKLIVLYPHPTDANEFERRYRDEHLPMAAQRIKEAEVTLTRIVGSPAGPAPYYRAAEITFPSMGALQSWAGSEDGQAVAQNAGEISSGGPPTVLIAQMEG